MEHDSSIHVWMCATFIPLYDNIEPKNRITRRCGAGPSWHRPIADGSWSLRGSAGQHATHTSAAGGKGRSRSGRRSAHCTWSQCEPLRQGWNVHDNDLYLCTNALVVTRTNYFIYLQDGQIPLCVAAQYRFTAVAELLLKAGAHWGGKEPVAKVVDYQTSYICCNF